MALPLIQLGLIAAAFLAGSAVMKQGKEKQKVVDTLGPQVNERLESAEDRLEGKIKSIEDDVKEREAATKLRDLELAAGQRFPEGGPAEPEEEEGMEDEMGGLTEADRLLLQDLMRAQDEEEPEDDGAAENQRQSARELIEYEQYLVDKNERLRRLEALQFAQGGTPIPPTTNNPFQQCWPCPGGQVCPQVCYPLNGPPPPWYSTGTGGGTPAPTTPTGPTCPPGYEYDTTFNVCITEEGDFTMPTAPPPTPTPTGPPPPTSQPGGTNQTRCTNVYGGSCSNECSSGNAQLCVDCNTVCGSNIPSTTGGSNIVRDESKCKSKFNGSCGTECSSGNASDCNECRIVCGEGSNYARRMAYEAYANNTFPEYISPPADNMAVRLLYYTRGRY